MNVIIFGAPAAGKGTLAVYLEKKYGMKQLSTGHILRNEFYNNPKYKKIKEDSEAGLLAPDALAIGIVESFLDTKDVSKGVVFDGFPRDLKQAEVLEGILKSRDMKLDYVISLDVTEEDLIERMSGRYSCKDCGESYHKEFKPTKQEGSCDSCESEELHTRVEDSPEALKERMKEYYGKTMPLIEYYKEKGLLVSILSNGGPEIVQNAVDDLLE